MLPYNKRLKKYSRQLRKNMTDAEKKMWMSIRGKQLKSRQFYRQKIIGDYIVDFYCPKAKLVIELDGGQHYINKGKQRDRERDRYLRGLGLEVLSFSDRDFLKNQSGVLNPPLSPFNKGGCQGDCSPFFKGRFEVTHSKAGKT
jgi:very-short-patch-repair endonuclease